MNLRPFFRQELEVLCLREVVSPKKIRVESEVASPKKIRVESEGVAPQPQRRSKVRRTGTVGTPGAFGKQPYR